MTDKLAALLHVWESDLQELATYEALCQGGVEGIELRAKREQLAACVDQLRTAVARPLPPDVRKHLEDWANGVDGATPPLSKPLPEVFFIGTKHQWTRFLIRHGLGTEQVIPVSYPIDVRGYSPDTLAAASVYVCPEFDWRQAQPLLDELRHRGLTRTFSPVR